MLTAEVKLYSSLPIRSEASEEMDHAFDVTVLSVLIGQHLRLPKNELNSIATSALLHDSGRWVLDVMEEIGENELDPAAIFEHPTLSMLLSGGHGRPGTRNR
ncbi:MAG: hypothetical protein MAG453_00549 [Calditrichaeota bacterium]|nr:hypothetical protein [Calditrichota bacterium]